MLLSEINLMQRKFLMKFNPDKSVDNDFCTCLFCCAGILHPADMIHKLQSSPFWPRLAKVFSNRAMSLLGRKTSQMEL